MNTDDLIAQLSLRAAPSQRHAAILLAAVGAGVAVSFAAMWQWLGIRPDFAAAALTNAFWIKFAYTLAIAALAFWMTERLGRPGAHATLPETLSVLPVATIVLIAAFQFAGSPLRAHTHLLFGGSANVCPWRIAVLSLPIFVAAFFGLRMLAPTRLARAGAAAGLLAGAAGAFIYAFHCNESAAPFVAVWYTLGIAIPGALGAVLGKWLLRW